MSTKNNVNIYTKAGETIFLNCNNAPQTTLYILEQMNRCDGLVVFKNESDIPHTVVRANEIAGFQIHPSNPEVEELVKKRMDLELRRLDNEARELDAREDSERWRG